MDDFSFLDLLVEKQGCFMACQIITFDISLVLLILFIARPSTFTNSAISPWVYCIVPAIFIGLQIFAIIKFGFKESFSFLKYNFRLRGGHSGGPK
jgi:hypothetical protein